MKWGEKPYYSLDYYLKQHFHTKVVKLSLDAGFTCPNRDGTISVGGCSFCSAKGSGDFAGNKEEAIFVQMEKQKKLLNKKWPHAKYIAYFQAFTNTYAPVSILRKVYEKALSYPDVVGIAIATRPDCIDLEVLELLKKLHKETFLWVELGLQTARDDIAHSLNRGYPTNVYEKTVRLLQQNHISVVTHMILGLPGETKQDMKNTLDYITKIGVDGVKFQLLHILQGTSLAKRYQLSPFPLLDRQEYIVLLGDLLKRLPPEVVVHRLTGDGAKQNLIAPSYSLDKRGILNDFHQYLKKNQIYQSMDYPSCVL